MDFLSRYSTQLSGSSAAMPIASLARHFVLVAALAGPFAIETEAASNVCVNGQCYSCEGSMSCTNGSCTCNGAPITS